MVVSPLVAAMEGLKRWRRGSALRRNVLLVGIMLLVVVAVVIGTLAAAMPSSTLETALLQMDSALLLSQMSFDVLKQQSN